MGTENEKQTRKHMKKESYEKNEQHSDSKGSL